MASVFVHGSGRPQVVDVFQVCADVLVGLTARVARWPKLIVAFMALMLVAAAGLSLGLSSRLTSGWSDWDDPGAANVHARQTIERATGINAQQGYVLLVRLSRPIRANSSMPARVRAAVAVLQQRPEVRGVVDYRTTRNGVLISRNGRQTLVLGRVGSVKENKVVPQLERQIRGDPVLADHVTLGGPTNANAQLITVVLHDLAFAEAIVFPLLFVLLIVVFRGVVAALLPLLGGAVSVLGTLLAMRVIVSFETLSVFGLNLVLALGLGLSVDFSLLIVSRYREQLRVSGPGLTALQDTMNSAGRTVMFSGMTVGSALLALLIFPQRFLYSMGVCGIVVVGIALVYALVILPALLTLLGSRVEALAPQRRQRPTVITGAADPTNVRWRTIATAVMRRPALWAVVASVVLLTLASPLLGVKFTAVQSANTLPGSVSAGRVAQAMDADFALPITDQEDILVTAPPSATGAIARYEQRLRRVTGVAAVMVARPISATNWLVQATLAGQPNTDATRTAVRGIEQVGLGYQTQITGPTSDGLSLNRDLARNLPYAAVILMVATVVLLFAMTGSVVLPVMAIVMNALSLGAALGIVVFVFQHGHFAGLFGTTGQGALESTSPIILAAVAFGLSTDYGVFLLSRIKEARDRGSSDREAVAVGMERTGRIVTSAALLFCIAMGALLLARLPFTEELGFGAALAVVLDATVVRAVLVPALMTLLGRVGWWAPVGLRQLHQQTGRAHDTGEQPPAEVVPS